MKYLAVIGILLCVIVGGLIVLLTFGNDYDSIDVDTNINGNVYNYGETLPIKAVEKSSRVYGIKQIMQLPELPTGCEVTALTMVLNFFGHDADKLEIAQDYLEKEKLSIEILGRGFAWLDTGTHESLLQASNFVQAIESNKGEKIACLEEIALKQGFITKQELSKSIGHIKNNEYYDYIKEIINAC